MGSLGNTQKLLVAIILFVFCQNTLAEPTGSVYRQAIGAFDSQNWQEAATQFKKAYQCDPTSPEAEDSLFFWGESLLQSGQPDKARECFDDYLRQWPKGRRARAAQFRAAESLMLGKRYKEAKHRIERFSTLYPADPLQEYTTAYLAEIAVAENDLAKAEQLFTEVIQKYPKGNLIADSRLGLARIQASQGNAEKCLATLAPIIQHPNTKSRTYREAFVLQSSLQATLGKTQKVSHLASEPEESLPTDNSTTEADPYPQTANIVVEDQQPTSNVDVMWRKARFFERSGKLGPAIVAYEDLYRKLPHTTKADEARLAAARLYSQLHQHHQARAIYDELLIRAGKEGNSLSQATILLEAAQAQEKLEEEQSPQTNPQSVDILKRLLRQFPSSPEAARAAYRLARHTTKHNDFETAHKYLPKALAADDTLLVGQSLQLTWRIAAAEKDWKAVRQAAERFLSLDEKNLPEELGLMARFWIAEADYRTGQFKSAHHRFDALAKRIEDCNLSWKGLVALRSAQTFAQLGEFSAARNAAEKASAVFSDFTDHHEFDYLIGQCAFAQGEYTTARAAFNRVIQTSPSEHTEILLLAREAIASTYFAQEDYESAATEFAKLQQEGTPSSYRAKSLHYTALCYEHLGQKSHAETLYQRLVDRYPSYPLR